MVYYYLFSVFHLCKVLFSRFLQFKDNFVDGQNNSKYRDEEPLSNGDETQFIKKYNLLAA